MSEDTTLDTFTRTDSDPSTDQPTPSDRAGPSAETTEEADSESDLYHPRNEWDEITDESTMGIDGGRQAKLDAIENKPAVDILDLDDGFDSIDHLANALRELSVIRQDGHYYLPMPEDELDTIRSLFDDLPEEAKPQFLSDDELIRRVNTARRRFNDWLGRAKRFNTMPGWAEAGPANYNSDKFNRLSESKDSAREELTEAIDRVRAGVNGGVRQRALDAIGSSVAEQNEKEAQSELEQLRDRLEPGMLLIYRNPRQHVGFVSKVNKKSVRVQRPNPSHPGKDPLSGEPVSEYITGRIDIKPEWFVPINEETFDGHREEIHEINEDVPDTYDEATEYLRKEK